MSASISATSEIEFSKPYDFTFGIELEETQAVLNTSGVNDSNMFDKPLPESKREPD